MAEWLIFKLVSVIDGWGISCKIALGWMSLNLAQDKSTLIQVMAWCHSINSLAPGKFEWKFRYLIFLIILVTDGQGISCELAFRWMSLDLTDKSTLVQVMAWCRQATSHYLSQCSSRSLSPYGIARPQWVKRKQLEIWPMNLKDM